MIGFPLVALADSGADGPSLERVSLVTAPSAATCDPLCLMMTGSNAPQAVPSAPPVGPQSQSNAFIALAPSGPDPITAITRLFIGDGADAAADCVGPACNGGNAGILFGNGGKGANGGTGGNAGLLFGNGGEGGSAAGPGLPAATAAAVGCCSAMAAPEVTAPTVSRERLALRARPGGPAPTEVRADEVAPVD